MDCSRFAPAPPVTICLARHEALTERRAANDARPPNTTPTNTTAHTTPTDTTQPHSQTPWCAMTTTAVIGWAGTVLVIASYAQPSVRRLRTISLVASLVLITFNALLGIWSNVVLEVALVLINIARLTSAPNARQTADNPATQTLPEHLSHSSESHSYERQFQ